MPLIIDDSNYNNFLTPPRIGRKPRGKGFEGMWHPQARQVPGFGEIGVPLIPESEWADRIREQERMKSNLQWFAIDSDLPCCDQGQTNYCWINAPVYCCELIRLRETGKVWSLSPASAGARIKGFRNVGGWGSEGLEWLLKHGVNETSDWSDNAIQRSFDTPENRQKAMLHRVVEYFKLDSWAEVGSCILSLIPVALGYNWWSHEVTGTHLTTGLDLGIRNSWGMGWGEKGYGVLAGSRKFPDDAVAIVSMQPI